MSSLYDFEPPPLNPRDGPRDPQKLLYETLVISFFEEKNITSGYDVIAYISQELGAPPGLGLRWLVATAEPQAVSEVEDWPEGKVEELRAEVSRRLESIEMELSTAIQQMQKEGFTVLVQERIKLFADRQGAGMEHLLEFVKAAALALAEEAAPAPAPAPAASFDASTMFGEIDDDDVEEGIPPE